MRRNSQETPEDTDNERETRTEPRAPTITHSLISAAAHLRSTLSSPGARVAAEAASASSAESSQGSGGSAASSKYGSSNEGGGGELEEGGRGRGGGYMAVGVVHTTNSTQGGTAGTVEQWRERERETQRERERDKKSWDGGLPPGISPRERGAAGTGGGGTLFQRRVVADVLPFAVKDLPLQNQAQTQRDLLHYHTLAQRDAHTKDPHVTHEPRQQSALREQNAVARTFLSASLSLAFSPSHPPLSTNTPTTTPFNTTVDPTNPAAPLFFTPAAGGTGAKSSEKSLLAEEALKESKAALSALRLSASAPREHARSSSLADMLDEASSAFLLVSLSRLRRRARALPPSRSLSCSCSGSLLLLLSLSLFRSLSLARALSLALVRARTLSLS